MMPHVQQRIDDLFEQALDLEPTERKAFLDLECEGDSTLHAAVAALIADHERAEAADFLGRPAYSPLTRWSADETAAPRPQRVAGYEVLGELGRGGMGVVYKARQAGLNRLVALKMVLGGDLARPDALARLLGEAEAIARVSNPNIVQVYEVGRHEDRAYFAMELVDGASLADKLDGGPLAYRQAAELIDTLARAVHVAHQAGIVHRDLKPSNILLTTGGVPKVTDFGLAKYLEAHDGLTESGVAMGTPSYMAPEQARGRSQAIGPACDVYALGAVLYECLTGRPPFRAESALDTVSLVVHQEPVPPRVLQPKLPRDLDTICLKCLQKDPARRYTSALDLADDLRRCLNGEPIRARPVGHVERMGRWCRRHPGVAALLAALALVVGGAFGSVTGLWLQAEQERKRADHERDQAQANLELAETNYQQAKKAVDDCFLLATEEPLLQQESMRQARKLLLERALPFYQGFKDRRGDDPAVLAGLARNRLKVAYITREIGRQNDALRACEQARDLLSRLVAAHPDVAEYIADLAKAYHNLGNVQHDTGQADAALRSLEQARKLITDLLAQHAEVATYQNDLARTWNSLAIVQHEMDHRREAAQSWEQARVLQARLANAHPDVPDYQAALALTHRNLAWSHTLRRDATAARTAYQEALRIQTRLVAGHPRVAEYQSDLANTYNNLAVFQHVAESSAAVLKSLEAARELQAGLVTRYPEVTQYRRDLANTCSNLGNVHQDLNETGAAGDAYELAEQLQLRLVADHPDVPAYRVYLARTYRNLGNLHSAKDPRRAREAYKRALDLRERLAADYRDNAEYQRHLAEAYVDLGFLACDTNELDASVEWYTKAVKVLEALGQGGPDPGPTREALQDAYRERARPFSRLARHAEALADWDRMLALTAEAERDPFLALRTIELAYLGQHAKAAAAAMELARKPQVAAKTLYYSACVHAVAFASVRQDQKLSPAERTRLEDQYVAAAVDLLQQARAKGYFKEPARIADMERDKDVEPLRSRIEFQAFVAQLRK
jgi:tetratricopeptide (TPR) repeat protein/tRNA A-37 threonylcarbamoyl transferase component Bud32